MSSLEPKTVTTPSAAAGSFLPAVNLLNTTAWKESGSQGNNISQWIYTLLINFSSSSQRPTPTHESDELVFELGVQAGDHHLHGVADLPHALVLGAAHSLHVPLLKNRGRNLHTAAPPTQTRLGLTLSDPINV